MLEYIIAAAFVILMVSVIILFGVRRSEARSQSSVPPNVYDESYFPGMRGSTAGPFPVGKRTERKKTETFQQNSDN
jgi:hypothetical protein